MTCQITAPWIACEDGKVYTIDLRSQNIPIAELSLDESITETMPDREFLGQDDPKCIDFHSQEQKLAVGCHSPILRLVHWVWVLKCSLYIHMKDPGCAQNDLPLKNSISYNFL